MNNRDLLADKEKQEPPDLQKTTHLGVLEGDKERRERQDSPDAECNLLLIMPSLHRSELLLLSHFSCVRLCETP